MRDTKDSSTTKYNEKTKEQQGNATKGSQSQDPRPNQKHNLSVDRIPDRRGENYLEKTKAGTSGS